MKLSVLILMQILVVVKVYGDDCARPSEVIQYEEDCFSDHSGFIEKVQQKATSLFESAKKKLGIATDDQTPEIKPKKCDYYQCILKKMHVTNQHGLPDLDSLKVKYANEMPEDMSDVNACFAMADSVEKMMHSDEDTVAALNSETTKVTIKQARDTMNEILCEINSQVVRCLSQISHKDNKCPLFIYP